MRARAQGSADGRYLYEHIYLELRQEILSGKYRKGDWFPPERVLKDRFGTTHLTVRNALAKLVLEGYIERYSGKGTVVIYAREGAAVPRTATRFPWAHVILEDLDEPNAALLRMLEARLRRIPLAVRISCHAGDVLLERALRHEAEQGGALVIYAPTRHGGPEPDGDVSPGIYVAGGTEARAVGSVLVDEAGGARAAVRLAHQRGHRPMALLSAERSPGLQRGFIDELAALALPADAGSVASCGPGVEGGLEAGRVLLASGFRAFFCASDETAAGALAAVREAGLMPPSQASVIGFGATRLARALGLTSVDPRHDAVADRVVAMVLAAMNEGILPAPAVTLVPEIRVRDT